MVANDLGAGQTAGDLERLAASERVRADRCRQDALILERIAAQYPASSEERRGLNRARDAAQRDADRAEANNLAFIAQGQRTLRHHRADLADAAEHGHTAYVAIRGGDGAIQSVSGVPEMPPGGYDFMLAGAQWWIGDVVSVTTWQPAR